MNKIDLHTIKSNFSPLFNFKEKIQRNEIIRSRHLNPIYKKLIYITIFLLGFQQQIFSQPVPNFSADVTNGCSPISVAFTNLSTPSGGATYLWDFGNGNTSTATNPQTTYIQTGEYTVTLTITHEGVSETLIRENYIKVHENPAVSFTLASDTIGCAPFSVTFTDQTSNPGGGSLTYTWSFGDGSKSGVQNPTHIYQPAGVFDATLLVENEFGCSGAYTYPHKIHVIRPQAAFGIDQTQSCSGELNVSFTNISQARSGYTSHWEFGDGTVSDNHSPQHHYQQPGTYSVTLTVTDDLGCTNSTVRQNLVQIIKTTAAFQVSASTVCPGQNVRFTNQSQHATNFFWRFGDGTTSRSRDIQKSYLSPGNYEVWLFADNGTCVDSVMQVVTVEKVVADFDVSKPFICQLPATISYTNRSENAVSYEWRFGNGTVSTQQSPSVTYTEGMPGTNTNNVAYTDTLIVTSQHGCKATIIKPNSVRITMPRVLMSPGSGGNQTALSGCVPMNLTFTNQTQYDTPDDQITDVRWRVRGGAFQSGQSVSVSVTEAERVPVELFVTTAKGCVHSNVEFINAGKTVNVDFNRIGNYEVCASSPVEFRITSPPITDITREIWDFGDDSEPGLPMPIHNYTKTGPMNVTLTIYNLGCPSKITKTNIVNIRGPIAEFVPESDCNTPYTWEFKSKLIDATSWSWDFGDGSPEVTNIENPVHHYTQSGNYTVRLTATNSSTGCQYQYNREIYVRNLKSDFSISGALPCRGNTLTLDGTASQDISPFSHQGQTIQYLWRIEEENRTIGSQNAAITHRFVRKGTNTISLIVRDANGCRDTLRKTITIHEPAPEFEADYKLGCMPVTFGFTDKTISEQPITNWLWAFGDGNSSSLQNPTHDYVSFGGYNVSLEVTDAIGCKNKITKNQVVQAVFPDATFSADNTALCIGETIRFFDTSNSNIVSYHWEFGTGDISSLAEPLVHFPDTGYYSAKLTIVDAHGCEMTQFTEKFVHVQEPPKADFTADVTNSNCYPLVVQFTDLSETDYPGSWTWHFGENNNLSLLQNPFFIYNRPGKHDVRLISRSSYGCADTIVKKDFIDIGGPFASINVPDSVCLNTDVWFTAVNRQNVHDIRWDFGDGYTSQNESDTHQYSSPGTIYPVLFLRSDEFNTCNKAIVDTLHVLDLRARFSVTDNSISGCVPWQVSLANESLNATSFQWDFGNQTQSLERTPSPLYETAGNYNIKLLAMHHIGCRDSITVENITIHPLPEVTISRDTLICHGDAALLSASGGVDYKWSPEQSILQPHSAVTAASPEESTWFVVQVTDEHGCINYNGTMVTVQQKPVVSLSDTTLIIGESFQIELSDEAIVSYQWSPDEHISCSSCPNPVFTAMETTTYLVAVTDVSNCFTISYPLTLTVQKIYSVDLPQAFTPNGDGINDEVYVKGWGLKELVVLRIFNRFGQVVFETTDINQGWDGTFKGKPQPLETYTYVVQVLTHEDKVLSKTGSIRLLR